MNRASPIRMVVSPSLRGNYRATLAVVYAPNALHAARRFERVQRALLSGDINFPNPSVTLAAFLVAFDGIVTRESLIGALGACREAYKWRDAICIDWKTSCGRVDRRHLSVWTRFVLAQPDALLHSPEQAVTILDQCFQKLAADWKYPQDLEKFLGDGQAWLSLNLAGPWFAHAIGAARLTGLPRSVFARESSQQALAPSANGKDQESEQFADSAIGLALDAYLASEAVDGGNWLVDEVMTICHGTATRKEMVKNLLSIAARSGKGRISSLILAWATDLAESGTRNDAEISSCTVSKYVRAISRELLDVFRGKALEDLRSGEFDAAYRRIITSKPTGTKRNCASALSSWHSFLEAWLDVAPRTLSLHRDLPEPVPRANVLWPHELQVVADWLGQAETSRVNHQTRVAFSICSAIRIRTNELVSLRLKNVRQIGGNVEVEICTSVTDDGLKSQNARRVQTIDCLGAAELIAGWKQRRLSELAMPNDYLFGDPHHAGRPYQVGQMQLLINRLLKDATGDPSVSIHTFSHHWATRKFTDPSPEASTADINVFDLLSAAAGHGDAPMSFKNYVHRFEEAIRTGIDAAVAAKLRWPEMSQFVTIGHQSYRQRLSRQARSMTDVDEGLRKLDLVRRALPPVDLPDAHHGIETAEPVTTALRPRATGTPLSLVADVLTDVAVGLSEEIIALRACREHEDIERIVRQTAKLMVELGEFRPSAWTTSLSDLVDELCIAFQGAARGRINFTRIKQKKLLPLRETLANDKADVEVSEGLRSWLQCYRCGYASLARPSRATALVRLLRKCEVPASAIGIFHVPANDQTGFRLHEEIEAVFAQEYAALPMKITCGARGGRPAAYFSIAGTDFHPNTSSASKCMTGFNALMLSACVSERLSFNKLHEEN